jgi:glucose-1-phosphate adenylyltransferase
MGIYVFSTRVLINALMEDSFRTSSCHDFGKDIIPRSISRFRVCAYDFTSARESTTYWRDVGTIDSYYRSQMELLLLDSHFDPYKDARWPTYAFGGQDSGMPSLASMHRNSAVDSVVSAHSIISDARICQSVISPGVLVEAAAEVQGAVLLPGVRVGKGARIRRAVIDENAEIPEGAEIGYDLDADRRRYCVTPGGVVVVSTNAARSAAPDLVRSDFGLCANARSSNIRSFLAS